MITACQDYAVKYPQKWISELQRCHQLVLQELNYQSVHHGSVFELVETRLAEKLGYHPQSIRRAFAYFAKIGIIKKEILVSNNLNVGIRVTLTRFFSFHHVRAVLRKHFNTVSNFIMDVGLLLTEYVLTSKKKKSKILSKVVTYSSSDSFFPSVSVRPDKKGENLTDCKREDPQKGEVSMKFDESSIRQCLEKEFEMEQMGEVLANIDTAKLMAFPEECVREAWAKMRYGKPQKPFAYFMRICLEWCKEHKKEPNWNISDHVREHKLLDHYRPSVREAMEKKQAEREAERQSGKTERRIDIEQTESKQNEKWKRGYESSEAKKRRDKLLAEAEGKTFDPHNEYAIILINTLKSSLKEYAPGSADAQRIRAQLREWGIEA